MNDSTNAVELPPSMSFATPGRILVALAAVDVLVVALVFGPPLVGTSLRFLPHFDDVLPQVGVALFWPSLLAALSALSATVREKVLVATTPCISYFVVCSYALLVGGMLGSVYIRGI